MNAPDDKTERSLRQYFDDFDANYEADGPSPAAWERIEAQIKPAPNSQKSLLVGLLLLLFLSGSVWYFFQPKAVAIAQKPVAVGNINQPKPTQTPIIAPKTGLIQSPAERKTQSIEAAIAPNTATEKPNNGFALTQNDHPAQTRLMPQPRKFTARASKQISQISHSEVVISTQQTTDNETLTPAMSSFPNPQLGILDAKDLKLATLQKATPSVVVSEAEASAPKPKTRLSWLVSVQPFQTFQWLTNVAQARDFSLANIYTPSLLSGQRTGVQFRVVVEGQETNRMAWRVSGFYRLLPQFVHYEISTNQFAVREVAPNQVSVERITIEVSERSKLGYFGLHADYLYRFGRNWFVSAGFEGATSGQPHNSTLGFTGSLGWERKIGAKTALIIEPTYTYFTNKTADTRQILNLQPYSVGLKMGVKIGR